MVTLYFLIHLGAENMDTNVRDFVGVLFLQFIYRGGLKRIGHGLVERVNA